MMGSVLEHKELEHSELPTAAPIASTSQTVRGSDSLVDKILDFADLTKDSLSLDFARLSKRPLSGPNENFLHSVGGTRSGSRGGSTSTSSASLAARIDASLGLEGDYLDHPHYTGEAESEIGGDGLSAGAVGHSALPATGGHDDHHHHHQQQQQQQRSSAASAESERELGLADRMRILSDVASPVAVRTGAVAVVGGSGTASAEYTPATSWDRTSAPAWSSADGAEGLAFQPAHIPAHQGLSSNTSSADSVAEHTGSNTSSADSVAEHTGRSARFEAEAALPAPVSEDPLDALHLDALDALDALDDDHNGRAAFNLFGADVYNRHDRHTHTQPHTQRRARSVPADMHGSYPQQQQQQQAQRCTSTTPTGGSRGGRDDGVVVDGTPLSTPRAAVQQPYDTMDIITLKPPSTLLEPQPSIKRTILGELVHSHREKPLAGYSLGALPFPAQFVDKGKGADSVVNTLINIWARHRSVDEKKYREYWLHTTDPHTLKGHARLSVKSKMVTSLPFSKWCQKILF